MGTLTANELKDELAIWLGSRDDISDTRLFGFLNLAQQRLARRKSFEEFEKLDTSIQLIYTPADSDRFITLPSDIKKIRSWVVLDGTSSRKLVFRNSRQWDKITPAPEEDSREKPRIYTKFQGKAEIWPLPDQTYNTRLRYSAWPTVLAADGDASDFDNKDDVLLNLAMVIAYTSLGNIDKGKEFWVIYNSLLKDVEGEDSEKPDQDYVPETLRDMGLGMPDEYWANPFVGIDL